MKIPERITRPRGAALGQRDVALDSGPISVVRLALLESPETPRCANPMGLVLIRDLLYMSKGHLFSQEQTHVVHCQSDWDFAALSLCLPWYCVQFVFCLQAWLVRPIQKIVIRFDHRSEIRKRPPSQIVSKPYNNSCIR
jgi:hypothetical protein